MKLNFFLLSLITSSLASSSFKDHSDDTQRLGLMEGEKCQKDRLCFTLCCNNEGNNTIDGVCVSPDKSVRCKRRSKIMKYTLWMICTVTVLITGACVFASHQRIQEHKERLIKIKTTHVELAECKKREIKEQ